MPWIVAIGHEMLYSSHDSGHQAQAKLLREGGVASGVKFAGLEDLFHEFGVDLYFSGHEHVYGASLLPIAVPGCLRDSVRRWQSTTPGSTSRSDARPRPLARGAA